MALEAVKIVFFILLFSIVASVIVWPTRYSTILWSNIIGRFVEKYWSKKNSQEKADKE